MKICNNREISDDAELVMLSILSFWNCFFRYSSYLFTALIALLYREYLNRPWFLEMFHSILFEGNRFYGGLSGMLICRILWQFNNRSFRLQFEHKVLWVLRKVNTEDFEAKQQSIRKSINNTALYLSPMSSSFYIFDSHEHDVIVNFLIRYEIYLSKIQITVFHFIDK
jgi:hypothetical protein